MTIKLIAEVPDLLSNFRSGNDSIDKYFKCQAKDDAEAVTYCFIDENKNELIALSTLSCNGIIIKANSLIQTVPAVEIKYFAVNEDYHSKPIPIDNELMSGEIYNWSDYCFDITIRKIVEFTCNYCGAGRVFLYSVEKAIHFYERKGMKRFTGYMHKDDRNYLDGCTPMFLVL